MPRAPVADRLRHILDAIARIETLTAGKSFEDYAADWVTRDAVERNLERVSEASRHVPSKSQVAAQERSLAGGCWSRQRPAPRLSAGEGPARLADREPRPRSAQSRRRGDAAGDRRQRARPDLSRLGAARSLDAEVLERSGSFGLGASAWVRSYGSDCQACHAFGFVRTWRGSGSFECMRHGFRRPGAIGPGRARALHLRCHGALALPGLFTGIADTQPRTSSV
jgi:Ribonuclease HepT-like